MKKFKTIGLYSSKKSKDISKIANQIFEILDNIGVSVKASENINGVSPVKK